MGTYNSQVIYGFTEGTKAIVQGEGEDQQKLVSYDDFRSSLIAAEEALGQKITQDNAETIRLSGVVSDQGLQTLSGSASLADVIAEVNKINAILTNLTTGSKNRGNP